MKDSSLKIIHFGISGACYFTEPTTMKLKITMYKYSHAHRTEIEMGCHNPAITQMHSWLCVKMYVCMPHRHSVYACVCVCISMYSVHGDVDVEALHSLRIMNSILSDEKRTDYILDFRF